MTGARDHNDVLEGLKELHALERSAGERLASMIELEPVTQLRELLEWQRVRAEWHEDALRARLAESGEAPSALKGLGALARSSLEGMQDMARDDLARSARELYAGHHRLLAAYSLLELAAERADDEPTSWLARRHRAEQEEMAAAVASRWASFAAASGDRTRGEGP